MKSRLPAAPARTVDLRGASFDAFLAHAFDRGGDAWHVDEAQPATQLLVDPALQLAHAEKLLRAPAVLQRFTPSQRQQGLWFLPGWFQPDFFSQQLWNHDLPAGARISCASAMEVLYRDLFAGDPLGSDAHMWFDLLEDAAPGKPGDSAAGMFCADCAPVRRTLLGVLDSVLALPVDHCRRAALHGLNHWGTAAERARIIDGWLQRTAGADLDATAPGEKQTLRSFALLCRTGGYQ